MLTNLKAIVLLDDKSKSVIKTSISHFGSAGFKIISTLQEINDTLVENCNKLIVFEGYAYKQHSVSELEMYKILYDLEIYFLGSKSLFYTYSSVAECFEVDLAVLTSDVLNAALFHDKSLEEVGADDLFDMTATAKDIEQGKPATDEEASNLASCYLSMKAQEDSFLNTVKEVKKRNESLIVENDKLKVDRDKLITGYKQIFREIHNLNRMLKKYEAMFTKDVYDKLRLHDYPNKPLVIYFKEFEDFLNLDEFIYTLRDALRLQQRKSVKVIRLFDKENSRKMVTIPHYYNKVGNRYHMNEVIQMDFIAKSGDHTRILDKLLINDIGLDVLIVIDSKSYDDVVFLGSLLQLNLCRESTHLEPLHLLKSNTLVNDGEEESGFYWGFFNTVGLSNEEKFTYLSSKPAIINVLDLCRIFETTV